MEAQRMRQVILAFGVWAMVSGWFAAAGLAAAESFVPVRDKREFLSLVEGRTLQLRMFRINLTVSRDGTIKGSALGWEVTGDWEWKNGLFCREMDWSGTPIPFNCQLVEARGADEIRFTVDGGVGESAIFKLR
jgi:hypothetical protein